MDGSTKYIKKPVVIEARQWHKDQRFDPVCYGDGESACALSEAHIHTLEGPLLISDGDWIIKGVEGEFYPCKPSVFEKTYEQKI